MCAIYLIKCWHMSKNVDECSKSCLMLMLFDENRSLPSVQWTKSHQSEASGWQEENVSSYLIPALSFCILRQCAALFSVLKKCIILGSLKPVCLWGDFNFSGRLEPEKRRYESFASRVEKTEKSHKSDTVSNTEDQKRGTVEVGSWYGVKYLFLKRCNT